MQFILWSDSSVNNLVEITKSLKQHSSRLVTVISYYNFGVYLANIRRICLTILAIPYNIYRSKTVHVATRLPVLLFWSFLFYIRLCDTEMAIIREMCKDYYWPREKTYLNSHRFQYPDFRSLDMRGKMFICLRHKCVSLKELLFEYWVVDLLLDSSKTFNINSCTYQRVWRQGRGARRTIP